MLHSSVPRASYFLLFGVCRHLYCSGEEGGSQRQAKLEGVCDNRKSPLAPLFEKGGTLTLRHPFLSQELF